jgi:hypothetical protein
VIELAHDPWGGERGIDHQAKALPGEVTDKGEDAEAPAADQRVQTESSDQRRFRSCGIVIGARVPRARLRPPRLRTVNRSSL